MRRFENWAATGVLYSRATALRETLHQMELRGMDDR